MNDCPFGIFKLFYEKWNNSHTFFNINNVRIDWCWMDDNIKSTEF
jgi:hypothetical protein